MALFVASLVIFAGTQLLPGDAASVVLGRNGSPATVKALHERLHLDRPAYRQYLDWIEGLAHGDLGNSAVGMAQGATSAPIWPLISDAVVNSVILAVITALLMIPLSLGLGVLAAVLRGRALDHVISVASLAAIALPEFVIGSLLIGRVLRGPRLASRPSRSCRRARTRSIIRRSWCCRSRRCCWRRWPRASAWCAPAWSRCCRPSTCRRPG